MARQTLLLVDSDIQHLRVMEVSLRKAGYEVTTARDGSDALSKLTSARPDLIICDTDMPNLTGFEFCRELKAGVHADIPFLFLTSDNAIESKVRGLEAGADDYLIRPIYTRELAARVAMILERRSREIMESSTELKRYFGDLSKMGVVDLLQAMEMGQKDGTIRVDRDGVRGTLWFRNGFLIDANVASVQGVDAVYRMLTWDTGRFEIDFRPPRRPEAMNTPISQLVADGMKQLEAWSQIAEHLPPLETVFRVDYNELTGRIEEFSDEINGLVRLFDGQRNARQAISGSDLPDLAALEAVSQLYFEGVITIAEASASEDNSAIPEYKTSLPPAIQPTVADALLDTITSQTSMPAAVIPAPVDVQAIPDIQPTAAETPVYAEPPASPFESQVPKETGAPMVAKPVLPPSPPPPPPEAMGELSEAMASIPSQSGMPTEGEPSADDVSAKAAQEDTSASAQALHSAVTKKTQEDAFPEFKDPAAAKQSTEEDTFFSTDLGYEEDFDSVDMKADVSGSLDQGQEEHELSQASAGVPRLAIALAALILVGGGAFFVLRDTVEPMTVPSNSLETHWIDQKIKKQATVGAVAPIDAGWRIPNEPDGGIILDSVELAADAGNETATVGTTDEQGKTSETNAVATKTGTKETSVQKKQVKTPTATVETPRVNAEKSKRARGLTSEGIKLYKRGKFEAAIKKFETALSTSPGAKQTLVAYTKALLEMNRLRDALEAAEKVSRIDPNNGEIFLLLGNARQDLGMKTASIKAYKHYLKLEPNGSYANEIRQVIKGIQAAPN